MFKKSIALVSIIIIGLTISIILTTPKSDAFDFLKKKTNKTETKASSSDNKNNIEEKPSISAEPVIYENTKYLYKFSYPGNWILKDDNAKKTTVSVIDENGKLGNFSVNSTWMSDNFPVDPAFNALLTQAEQRKKHGELESFYIKNISIKDKTGKSKDIVKGVVVIESDIDPDYKRMQWQAYGGGNYYNFTACTSVAKFPLYKEEFKKIIDSIIFNIK